MDIEEDYGCFGANWQEMYRELQTLPAVPQGKKKKTDLQDDLINAIKAGDASAVRSLLEGGLDPHFYHQDVFSLSTLMRYFNRDIAEVMSKHGANFSAKFFIPHAIKTKDEEMMHFICSLKKDAVYTELAYLSTLTHPDNSAFMKIALQYAEDPPLGFYNDVCKNLKNFLAEPEGHLSTTKYLRNFPERIRPRIWNRLLYNFTIVNEFSLRDICNLQSLSPDVKSSFENAFPFDIENNYEQSKKSITVSNLPELLLFMGNPLILALSDEKFHDTVDKFIAQAPFACFTRLLNLNPPGASKGVKYWQKILENPSLRTLRSKENFTSFTTFMSLQNLSERDRLAWVKRMIKIDPELCLVENDRGRTVFSFLSPSSRYEAEKALYNAQLKTGKSLAANRKLKM